MRVLVRKSIDGLDLALKKLVRIAALATRRICRIALNRHQICQFRCGELGWNLRSDVMARSTDRTTLLAFMAIVVLGGVNGTAIKVTNPELGPFWGAALRFGLASVIFFTLVFIRRVPLPRGRRLAASMFYGILAFGTTFALVNWGLVQTPAGVAQIVLALVPLMTLLLASAQGLERLRLQNIAGSIVAIAGVALVFVERLGASLALLPILAILLAALSLAESNVVVKRFPRTSPLANNAVAMGTGAAMLLGISLLAGERPVLPQSPQGWLGLSYLVVIGSVVVFTLYLYVIVRWTASATSYALLLMPLVAVAVAAVTLGEPITWAVVVGGALVLAGVYLGAFAPSFARPLPGFFRREPRRGGSPAGPPALQTPNCP